MCVCVCDREPTFLCFFYQDIATLLLIGNALQLPDQFVYLSYNSHF